MLRDYADKQNIGNGDYLQNSLFAFDFGLEDVANNNQAGRFTIPGRRYETRPVKRSIDEASAWFILDIHSGSVLKQPATRREEGLPANATIPIHQDPSGGDMLPTRLDVIEQYILNQVNKSNSLSNSTRVDSSNSTRPHSFIEKRDALSCSSGIPCVDGSCCNKAGKCGFGADHCGADVCVSQCGAKATCGRDSEGGNKKCGLNICCSYYGWCGTTETYCKDPEPQFGKTPCQKGFGSCEVLASPACSPDGGSSGGRSVAYYQSWNSRDRLCNQVLPHQIDTRGLTHLLFAFLYFDPSSFEVKFAHPGDESLVQQFVALKTPTLQTWVAVGGWAFNDPGSTLSAFSNMVSTQQNRARFISSLVRFMERFDFQGADIDWEYPSATKRGGKSADAANLVLLMKELRVAFGTKYGLSIVLAPDYTYLSGSDPKAMEPYVDWFGFMSYDLHGIWDEDIPALGKKVRPQTNISEINTGLTPLWFAGINPAKVNLGLAYYGRTFTLADSGCSGVGCGFRSAGKAGKCTNFRGVLSNLEIQDLIREEGLTPTLLSDAAVKQIVYHGNQWVGYDDEETLAIKRRYANSLCLGGTSKSHLLL
ncbi:glycoside hydrolase [Westerdykella ornata]|uniref:chitinase n=1 Tax=Westerdykella ornata TaxID=318751 RepID=A0A6A6JV96_WESOR|nr:glycoside hydrolase [Westerdykella ornata]KAF2280023.1 glycoside hydrolase [Westerdykella ornata]